MSSGDLERLVTQLKEAIHDIVEGATTDTTKVYFEDDTRVLRLCFVLEKISHFGLKSGMFSRATVWDYLKNLDKCLPGSQSPLEWVTSSAKTEIGLTRVFFRHALNESALSEYMSALIYNETLTKKFYNKESVFLNDDARGIYLMLLESLNQMKFRLFLKDNSLNEFTYWNAYPDVLRRKTGTTTPTASPQREAPPSTKSVEDFPVAIEPPVATPEEKKKRKKKKKTESDQKTIDDLRLIEQAKIDEEREAQERKEKIKQEEMRLLELQQKEDQILREKQEKYLKDEQSRLENLKIHHETMFQQTKQLEMDKIQLERDRLQLERERLEKIQKEKEEQEKKDREEQERLFKEKERKLKEESEAKLREEKERIERENQQRLEQERQEKERLAREKEEQERKFEEERKRREKEEEDRKIREEQERERIIKEKLEEERRKLEEKKRKEEEERQEKERQEKQEQENIRKQLEIQREIQLAQQEKLKKKQEKLEIERQQREKEERDRKQREKEEKAEKERLWREKEEKERKQREKEEEERRQREKAEKERKEFEKAEKKRKKEEEKEKERQRLEKIEAEKRLKEEQEKRRIEEEKRRKEEEKRKKEEEKRLKKLEKEEKQLAEQKRLLEEERERIRKQVEQEEREKIRKQMEEERAKLLMQMREEEEERERERERQEAEKRKQEEERKKREEEEREKERLEHLRLLEEKRQIEEEKQKLEEEKRKLKEAEEELKRLETERKEKERQEKEKQEREKEKEENERQEREKQAERERQEKEKQEKEEKERQEKERQAREEKERREREERQREETERKEREEKERQEKEREEKEKQERKEKKRIEKEREEKERQEREERERKERKKAEKEKKEREERERQERERQEKERKKREKQEKEERERKEREEKERQEREERERKERKKAEKERKEREEREEKERQEKEKAERKEREKKEKIERERKEKEERERKEREEKQRQAEKEREEKERKEREEKERIQREHEEKEREERERKEKEEREKKERQEKLKQIEEEELRRKKAESEQRLKQLREEQERSEQKKKQESSEEEEEEESESEEETRREGAGGIVVAKGSGPVNNNAGAAANLNSAGEIGITEKLGKAASLVSKMFETDNQLGAGEKQKLLKIYESKIERLRNAIHNIVKESVGNVLYADNLHVTELCASVESILFHGILDTKFFGTTTYWDYLENISNCVPNGGDILNKIRKTTEITTDLGRGRCWIRIGLNDNALGQYIKSLLWDKELTNKFYHSHSIVRNEEQIGLILMLLDSLAAIRFSLTLNDERLNYPDGWEILKAEQTANLIRNQSAEQLHSSTSSNNSNNGSSKKRKTKKRKQKLNEISIENQPEIIIEETIGSYSSNSFAQRSSLSNDYENFKLPEIGNEKYAPISDTLVEDGIINVSESIQYMRQLYKNSNVSLAVIRQNIIKENSKNFFAEPLPSGSNPNLEIQVIEATTPPQKKETVKQSKLIEPEETFVKIVEVPEAKVKNSLSNSNKETPPPSSVPSPAPVIAEPDNQVLALPEVDLEEPVIRIAGDRRIYFLEILIAEKEKAEETDWYDISAHLKKEMEQKNQEKLANSRVGVPITTSMSSFTDSGPIPDVVSTTLYKPGAFNQKSCISCGSPFSRTGERRAMYCYYRGKYYCRKCHDKQVSIIPAYVIHNWDFRQYPVSKVSKIHIQNTATKPLLNILTVNPALYKNPKAKFGPIMQFRKQFILMAEFVHSCRSESRLVEFFESKPYMLENKDLFSLQDLCQHSQDALVPWMKQLYSKLLRHIGETCASCKGKGNYCEICKRNQLIFSFQFDTISKCNVCKAVYHKNCYTGGMKCPKCVRTAKIRGFKS